MEVRRFGLYAFGNLAIVGILWGLGFWDLSGSAF